MPQLIIWTHQPINMTLSWQFQIHIHVRIPIIRQLIQDRKEKDWHWRAFVQMNFAGFPLIPLIYKMLQVLKWWVSLDLGKDPATKFYEFLEKFQAAFDPPPSFLENYVAIFSWWIWLYVCKEVWGPDSMKCMHMPSSKCVLFWFFSTQWLKKRTLNPELTLFVSISCSKSPV